MRLRVILEGRHEPNAPSTSPRPPRTAQPPRHKHSHDVELPGEPGLMGGVQGGRNQCGLRRGLMSLNMPIPKAVFPILGAVLEFVTFPLRLLFSPLRLLDRPMARKEQAEFERKIRRDAEALFCKHGAEVVPNEGVPFPPPFDGAFVTVRADGMLIRFEEGRGDFNVRITSVERPQGWTDLELLLAAIETPDDVRRRGVATVFVAGRELDRHWDDLKQALRSDSVQKTIREFLEREETYFKAYSRELNRHLYGR